MAGDEELIVFEYEDYDPADEAPAGNITPDDQEGDCAGEGDPDGA